MTDVIRKTYFCQDEQIRTYHLKKPFVKKTGTMWRTEYLTLRTRQRIPDSETASALYACLPPAGTGKGK